VRTLCSAGRTGLAVACLTAVRMASGINFYSQLVISAIRISDISNLITDITNLK